MDTNEHEKLKNEPQMIRRRFAMARQAPIYADNVGFD
jgi:hypothetical protein